MVERINKLKEWAFSTIYLPIIVILIGVLGFLVGLYFYYRQLISSPLIFWIFIIDCPLYVILFSAVVAFRLKGYSNSLFNYIVSVGSIKYGLWTIFIVMLNIWQDFWMLVPLHMVLVFAGCLLILYSKSSFRGFVLVLAWFLFNDFLDYVIGTAPVINAVYLETMMYFSILSTLVIVPAVYIIKKFLIKQNMKF